MLTLKDTLTSQVGTYTGGSQLEWREEDSSLLPSRRAGLRAAVVDNHVYVTGGFDGSHSYTSILHWDPSSESWQYAGNLAVARYNHAAVGVPSFIVDHCKL